MSGSRLLRTAALAAVVLAAAGCPSIQRDPNELPLGAPMPAVRLKTGAGKDFPLAQVRKLGLPVVVFYRGHW
jgi:hypothetical protein